MSELNQSSQFRLSISARLTIWYGLTVLILLSLLALFSYANFHLGRHRDFDQHLAHEIRELTPFLDLEGEDPSFHSLEGLRSVAFQTHGLQSTYVRLISASGSVLYESPNFSARKPLSVQPPEVAKETTVSRDWEGNPARSMYQPLRRSDDSLMGWLEATGFEWSLHEQIGRLRNGLIAGIAVSTLLAIIAGFILARRALQPVVQLTHAANRIRATDLDRRLPTPQGVRDELTDLAETFNTMLQRLQDSFERERRFSDNAAHELLTPLATLANRAEITLRRGRSPETYKSTLAEMLIDIEELTDTVRGLLQLSRADKLRDIPQEPVDLTGLAEKCVERFRPRAQAKRVDLAIESRPSVFIRGRSQQLVEVFDNLLDNAVKYTPENGRIRVAVDTTPQHAVVTVSDSGLGFTQEEKRRIFDRFYRSEGAIALAHSGSGLGLPIVKTIVDAFEGEFSARSEGPGCGSTFEVKFPLA